MKSHEINSIYTKNGAGKIEIAKSQLREFIRAHGFRKLKNSNTDYTFIQVQNNIVKRVAPFVIRDFVIDQADKTNDYNLIEAVLEQAGKMMTDKSLEYLLSSEELKFKRGTENTGFFYFENGFVEITKDTIYLKDYAELDTHIWESKLRKRKINLNERGVSDFFLFIDHLVDGDPERFKSLCSIIGYLLHDFKCPSESRAVIFVDKTLSNSAKANGGTGKSLLVQGIKEMAETVTQDGKNLKMNSNFQFQQISKETEILYYDDVNPEFPFDKFYSFITAGVSVEAKYQKEFYLPYEESPKMVVSSNYYVRGTGGNSDKRRRLDFEIADYYRTNQSPAEEFGKHFFTNDWDNHDWNSFYHFIFSCVQIYLAYGIIEAEPINLKWNELVSSTNESFAEFAVANLSYQKDWKKEDILNKFIDQYNDYSYLKTNTLTKWIDAWGEYQCKSLKIEQKQSNNKNLVIITQLQQ